LKGSWYEFFFFYSYFLLILLVALASFVSAHQISCTFGIRSNLYACDTRELIFDESDVNDTITFVGEHLPGMDDNDVVFMIFRHSSIPFFVSQVFDVFPRLRRIDHWTPGMTQIQPRAFNRVVRSLEFILIDRANLTTIPAKTFTGLTHLQTLRISYSGVETLHPAAFVGLNNLEGLQMHGNKIKELPLTVFYPLRRLAFLELEDNQIKRLEGELFIRNPMLLHLRLSLNKIEAIERNFLDKNRHFFLITMRGNVCADFFLGGNIPDMMAELEECFVNFERE
jgi:hypothetical protein